MQPHFHSIIESDEEHLLFERYCDEIFDNLEHSVIFCQNECACHNFGFFHDTAINSLLQKGIIQHDDIHFLNGFKAWSESQIRVERLNIHSLTDNDIIKQSVVRYLSVYSSLFFHHRATNHIVDCVCLYYGHFHDKVMDQINNELDDSSKEFIHHFKAYFNELFHRIRISNLSGISTCG